MSTIQDVSDRHCLEVSAAKVLTTFVYLLMPAEACLVMLVVAHVSWALRLPGDIRWLPAASAIFCALWIGIALFVGRRLNPPPLDLAALKEFVERILAVRLPDPTLKRRGLVPGGALAVAVLVAPWWPAVTGWAALCCLLVGIYSGRVKASLVLSGVLMAVIGLCVLVIGFFLKDPGLWVSLVVGLVLTMALIAVAVHQVIISTHRRHGALRLARHVVPVFLVGLISFQTSLTGVVVIGIVGLVLWPTFLLLGATLLNRSARDSLNSLVNMGGLPQKLGQNASGPREDEIRESDGYYRVCYPEYRHWSPMLTGEAGYGTWLGGINSQVLGDESVLFRTTSLAPNLLGETRDSQGERLATLALQLTPNYGLATLQPLYQAFADTWTIRRSKRQEEFVPKMPWDHPYLLVVPVEWDGDFAFPAGSGIHDRDGYPCHAQRVHVHIGLKKSVLEAVDRLSVARSRRPDDSEATGDTILCRELLWNATRIMPAIYESLLSCLVEEFRSYSITLFVEHQTVAAGSVDGNDAPEKRRLIGALNEKLSGAVPEPVRHLVQCSVSNVALTTYYEGDIFSIITDLRQVEANTPFSLKGNFDRLQTKIENYVLGALATLDEESGRGELAKRIAKTQQGIRHQRDQAVDRVARLAKATTQSRSFAGVQQELAIRLDEFQQEENKRFDMIRAALNELTKATGSESLN